MEPPKRLSLSNSTTILTPPTTPSSSSSATAALLATSSGNRQGPRLIVDFSDFTVPAPTTLRSLQPEEFRRLFLVSLEKMFTLEPESIPFRQPVDPEEFGIPDYCDIIRKPMDLQTIRVKMNCLKYTDPWMFVDDVLLMFDNCWVFNRPESRIYHYCEKLSDMFQKEINPIMSRLGYRHGRIHQFNSQTLSCFGRPCCLILRKETYYNFLRFHLCEKCYSSNLEEEGVKLPWQNNVTVNKENFIQLVNHSENSYSPAAEMHRAYKRDAEMSRALVVREFLKILHSTSTHPEKKANIRKMLKLNRQLRSEFVRYFDQQREIGLLTPTETERIKHQLKMIREGEIEDANPTKPSAPPPTEEKENHENENEENDNNHLVDVLDLCRDFTESSISNENSTSPSNNSLGIDFESSSGSNCSTLSSLKSIN